MGSQQNKVLRGACASPAGGHGAEGVGLPRAGRPLQACNNVVTGTQEPAVLVMVKCPTRGAQDVRCGGWAKVYKALGAECGGGIRGGGGGARPCQRAGGGRGQADVSRRVARAVTSVSGREGGLVVRGWGGNGKSGLSHCPEVGSQLLVVSDRVQGAQGIGGH